VKEDSLRFDLRGEFASTIEKSFISTRELSDLLGVEQGTLATWRRRGIGPAWYQMEGHLVRYDTVEVLTWIRSQKSVQTPEAPQNITHTPQHHDGKEGRK
jgi:predicted DNA-binding transcriptional regulator AlpA